MIVHPDLKCRIFQLDLGVMHLLASALRFFWQATFGMCFRKKGSLLDKLNAVTTTNTSFIDLAVCGLKYLFA